MKAWGRLLAAAGAVLFVLATAVGASAASRAHRRHLEVRPPTASGRIELGTSGGDLVNLVLEEPDLAMLAIGKVDLVHLKVEATQYGAHFRGSLRGGRVRADFAAVGSIALRFRPGVVRKKRPPKGCEGKSSRSESGRWVGKVSLRGEGGYFSVTTGAGAGELDRTFRLRCRVKHPAPQSPVESLRERVEPAFGSSLAARLLGNSSNLLAEAREGGRQVEVRAAHTTDSGPGAEVEAGAFEYQGRMPVGRYATSLRSPAGTLVTSLPGEGPATATLKPGAPFEGEASYLATSPTTHSWTGTLAVRFPGLVVPLTGASFSSSLCVVSPLVKPRGCWLQSPNLQTGGESIGVGGR
jgi:hypothetical protein